MRASGPDRATEKGFFVAITEKIDSSSIDINLIYSPQLLSSDSGFLLHYYKIGMNEINLNHANRSSALQKANSVHELHSMGIVIVLFILHSNCL